MQSIKIVCRPPWNWKKGDPVHPNSTHVVWMGYDVTETLLNQLEEEEKTRVLIPLTPLVVVEISELLACQFIRTAADCYADNYDDFERPSVSDRQLTLWTKELTNDGFTKFK